MAMLIPNIAICFIPNGARGDPYVQKIIKEAERLTVIENRTMACNVLYRNLKKANKTAFAQLKEKLLALSRYFYSDKGYENYLLGKDLLEKQKYNDAAEKLAEANDLEKDNVEVLHLLSLAQLGMQKTNLASATSKRALQVCPIDSELMKDELSILSLEEKWSDVVKLSDVLIKEYGDGSAQTFKDRGLALYNLDRKPDSKKNMEQALAKDQSFPESYYWLGIIREKEGKEASKLLTKYLELCKNKSTMRYLREPNLCLNTKEAERRVSL